MPRSCIVNYMCNAMTAGLFTKRLLLAAFEDAFNTFFSETGAGKHVPRCVMVAQLFWIVAHCSIEI